MHVRVRVYHRIHSTADRLAGRALFPVRFLVAMTYVLVPSCPKCPKDCPAVLRKIRILFLPEHGGRGLEFRPSTSTFV